MSILQIVYKSLANEGLEEAHVLDILRVSQARNQAARISGLLVYRAPVFVQLLEGPPESVLTLYERIARDSRHHAVEDIERCHAERSAMPTWAMGYFSPTVESFANEKDSFVFNDKQIHKICEAMPQHIGAPFLDVLRANS